MTIEEYVESALNRLPPINSEEKQAVIDCLKRCYQDGFILEDAVRFSFYSEEVSPAFSEEFALSKMNPIAAKYRNKKFPTE